MILDIKVYKRYHYLKEISITIITNNLKMGTPISNELIKLNTEI